MIELKHIDEKVEKVLETQSISRAQQLMQSRSGIWIVSMISFVESALPIPILTDPFMAAGILLNRQQTKKIVVLTTIASVLGGVFAYASAVLFLDVMLSLMTPSMVDQFQRIVSDQESSTAILTLVGAITPVPYTFVAWAIPVIQGSLLTFILVSIFGRGIRYAIVGYCTYQFGPAALQYARRYLGLTSLVVLVLALAYLWYKM